MAKAYLAGNLTERITIQSRAVTTQNALGENTTAWADEMTLWARPEPLRGREYFAAGQMQAVADVRFVVRYSSQSAAIDNNRRVMWRGVPHAITSVIHVDGAKQWIELMTLQGARDGR